MKMMKVMKNIFLTALFALGLLTAPTLHAQTGFDDEVDDTGQADPDTPIDSYVIIGLAAGACMGYMLLKKQHRLT